MQLTGKEYVSNLVGLGFKPQLPHFFLINYLRPMVWKWRTHVAEGQGWPAYVAEGQGWPTHVAAGWGGRPTWKMVWGWRAHVEDSMGLWTHIMVR
jgi:hypothetical protein